MRNNILQILKKLINIAIEVDIPFFNIYIEYICTRENVIAYYEDHIPTYDEADHQLSNNEREQWLADKKTYVDNLTPIDNNGNIGVKFRKLIYVDNISWELVKMLFHEFDDYNFELYNIEKATL